MNSKVIKNFKDDLKFGLEQEDKIYTRLFNYFDDNIVKVKEKFSKFDYQGDTFVYEVKSRNNKLDDYPTTLIAEDKILKNRHQIFIFNFTDKLAFIKYSKKTFKKFEVKPFKRNFRYGYNDLEKNYIYIPVSELILID